MEYLIWKNTITGHYEHTLPQLVKLVSGNHSSHLPMQVKFSSYIMTFHLQKRGKKNLCHEYIWKIKFLKI